jgi:hypothetical protein
MDFRLIGTWLGLPAGPWPPDHYTLLGLKPGEVDSACIEQSVHERLMRVRSYQLTHPALATEAMTRLAKAFDCLTNPATKAAYDQAHFPHLIVAAPVASSRTPTAIASDTASTMPAPVVPPPQPMWLSETPLDWKPVAAPPPQRQPGEGTRAPDNPAAPPPIRMPPSATAAPEALPLLQEPIQPPPVRVLPEGAGAVPGPVQVATESPAGAASNLVQVAAEPPANPTQNQVQVAAEPPPAAAGTSAVLPPLAAPRLPFDPLVESIRSSSAVRRGIELRRGLYERVRWLRRLQRAWDRAGRYIHKPKRRLSKLAEETDLEHSLVSIEDLLQEAPAVLGEPGQPGYRVVALASQEPVIERFKALDDHDRALLARDWVSGRELLAAYRRFLRQQILMHRHLTAMQRMRRRIDALLTDHFLAVMVLLGIGAVLVLLAIYLWG